MTGKGTFMRGRTYLLTAMAAVLVAASPAEAKKKSPPPPVPVAAPQVPLPSSPNGVNVRYFYERQKWTPVWFKPGAGDRSDGNCSHPSPRADRRHGHGPEVAARVEAAVAAARAGDQMKHNEAELALSAAWVDYVQNIQRPDNNVIWGDTYLTLRPSNPERIMALLSAVSSSVTAHLQSVSTVNPVYSKLRDIAVAEATANGGRASDAVMQNLERSRILPASGKFILVNSAEQRLHTCTRTGRTWAR